MFTKRKKGTSYIAEQPQNETKEETISPEQKLEKDIRRKEQLTRQIKKDVFVKVGVFLAAFIITFTFIFGVSKAPTNDMFPAIHEGDVIVYFRLGDVINSDVVLYETDGEKNIGRVQAMTGSKIDSTENGQLTIDGNLQPIQKRSGIFDKTFINESGKLVLPSEVPERSYLVLADQRESAKDSREYGYIEKGNIKGKVFTIIRRRPL